MSSRHRNVTTLFRSYHSQILHFNFIKFYDLLTKLSFFFFFRILANENCQPLMSVHAYWRIRKIERSDYKLPRVCLSVRPSVRPCAWTRLPLHGFSWNFMFDCFSKIFRENSGLIKARQEWRVLYMKTNTRFRSHIAKFLEWEMFQTKIVEKIETHFMFNIFFLKSCRLWVMWKNIVQPVKPQMTIWRMRISRRLQRQTQKHKQ